MRIKQIILIIVVIAALAGAGVFGYMSINSKATGGVVPKKKGTILPHGNTLDFKPIDKFNQTGQLFNYPVVAPAEIGSDLNEIISKQK